MSINILSLNTNISLKQFHNIRHELVKVLTETDMPFLFEIVYINTFDPSSNVPNNFSSTLIAINDMLTLLSMHDTGLTYAVKLLLDLETK